MSDSPPVETPTELDRRPGVLKTTLVILAVIALFLSLFVYKISQPRILSDQEMSANGAMILQTPREFMDFELLDKNGQPFTKEQFEGKWTLLFPGFTYCPDICPITMAMLAKTYDQMDEKPKENLQVVLMSVDPNRDTPERLKQYVEYFNPDFQAITGDISTLLNLGVQLNIAFSVINPETAGDNYLIEHSGNVVLINPNGHYHGYFKPPFEASRLKVTYQSAWAEF